MRLFALWALWRAWRSKRRWRFWGDVRDYGARPDGFTDSTAAIQAALDEGGMVKFPLGTFRISETLRPVAGVHIHGAKLRWAA